MIAALLVAAAQPQPCFWQFPRDLPLAETNVGYWRGEFRLMPGEHIELAGTFPHARQMGFNIHRASDNAVLAGMPDAAIEPLKGASNPFRAGANRSVRKRAYSIVIGNEGHGLNRLKIGEIPGTGFSGRILYRIYLADRAKPGGGVPLPRLVLVQRDGSRTPLGGTCPDPARVDTAQPVGPTRIPPAPGNFTDPLDWRTSGIPKNVASGDVMVNRDNAYAYAMTDFRKGEVLVLRGKAPSHPKTLHGNRRMGQGEVRYWSICTYRHPSDRTAHCIADEKIPVDRRGWYTLAVSPAMRRPANARPECGVAWLNAATETEGLALLRHVAPDPAFQFSPSGGEAGASAAPVMGDYLPVGSYMSRTAFEAKRCIKN